MKYPILLILMATSLVGCDNPPTTANNPNTPELFADADPSKFPMLVVDDEHESDGTNSSVYQLPAGDGMRLDITKYQFSFGRYNITPNMVILELDKDHRFELMKPTETNIYVIDRKTLEQTGACGFPGFRSGDHWLISVSREVTNDVAVRELISWEGKIQVK